jgi:single-stranded-DNA-specific exonuclease
VVELRVSAAPPTLVERTVPETSLARLLSAGCHPLLARLYAARGVAGPEELDAGLERLHPPASMRNIEEMAAQLADAIAARARLAVIADYDADGATACAVALRALRAFGADVRYLVPNRFHYGYGLTPEIVREA